MVKKTISIGFIVEGNTEKLIIESESFRTLLNSQGFELVSPVINANGGGNLLPKYIDTYIELFDKKISHLEKIFVLTDP